MTLSHALLDRRSLPMQALMVVAGSALIALSARIEVPMYPVPMTLQTLMISLIGLTYGARLGALTVLAYLAEGAAGLPVFSGGNAGLAWLLAGPTAGYLWGFVVMAALTGWLAQRMQARSVLRLFVAAVLPGFLLLAMGAGWPAIAGALGMQAPWAQATIASLMSGWVLPFIPGTLVKSLAAAMIVAGGWKAARQG